MGDRLAAAGLQLCGAAPGRDDRRLLGAEAARADASPADVRNDGDAAQQPDWDCDCVLCLGRGFRADLAYLVDGDPGPFRRRHRDARVRLERRPRARTLRRRNSATRTGPHEPEAASMTMTTIDTIPAAPPPTAAP